MSSVRIGISHDRTTQKKPAEFLRAIIAVLQHRRHVFCISAGPRQYFFFKSKRQVGLKPRRICHITWEKGGTRKCWKATLKLYGTSIMIFCLAATRNKVKTWCFIWSNLHLFDASFAHQTQKQGKSDRLSSFNAFNQYFVLLLYFPHFDIAKTKMIAPHPKTTMRWRPEKKPDRLGIGGGKGHTSCLISKPQRRQLDIFFSQIGGVYQKLREHQNTWNEFTFSLTEMAASFFSSFTDKVCDS